MNLVEHKKARFDYEVLEELEAGIELFGHEVKSLRGKLGKLEGSHVIVRGGEAYVVGTHIPPYQPKNTNEGYDPSRSRQSSRPPAVRPSLHLHRPLSAGRASPCSRPRWRPRLRALN